MIGICLTFLMMSIFHNKSPFHCIWNRLRMANSYLLTFDRTNHHALNEILLDKGVDEKNR